MHMDLYMNSKWKAESIISTACYALRAGKTSVMESLGWKHLQFLMFLFAPLVYLTNEQVFHIACHSFEIPLHDMRYMS